MSAGNKITHVAYYNRKARYGGMEILDIKCQKELHPNVRRAQSQA
jgi:hypothetical protein